MLDKLYSSDILTLSSTLQNRALAEPDGTARKVSKLCGSWVEIDIKIDGDTVTDVALRVEACALGQASAAILQREILGATLPELIEARDALRAMLKEGGVPPGGRFSELALLEGVRDYPARHQSTLLAFEAAVEAVKLADIARCGNHKPQDPSASNLEAEPKNMSHIRKISQNGNHAEVFACDNSPDSP